MSKEVNKEFSLSNFDSYSDYLDSLVKDIDLKYLQDEDLARQLYELGYRGSGEALKREDFQAQKKKEQDDEKKKGLSKAPKVLSSAGRDFKEKPLLAELAKREDAVTNGKLTSIIFIRDYNSKGQEISGYIDYAHRLKSDNFSLYFDGKRKLLPKPSDLSYYNWKTQTSTCNPTSNFQVLADSENGLLFKNKRDRKIINVDPKATSSGDNSERHEIKDPNYVQIVIYDHQTRRKNWSILGWFRFCKYVSKVSIAMARFAGVAEPFGGPLTVRIH